MSDDERLDIIAAILAAGLIAKLAVPHEGAEQTLGEVIWTWRELRKRLQAEGARTDATRQPATGTAGRGG